MATSTIGTGYEIQNNVENLEKGLAIVQTGNTATQAITAGQFVYWKGTMYTASTAIASGTSYAVGTNLTACPNGGLNTLNEKFTTSTSLYSANSVSTTETTITLAENYTNFLLIAIVVGWGANGSESGCVVLPSYMLGASGSTKIYLNNNLQSENFEFRKSDPVYNNKIRIKSSHVSVSCQILGYFRI